MSKQIITDTTKKEKKEHGDYGFPFLISYEHLDGYDGGSFLWHWHPEAELTLITDGAMQYRINDTVFSVKKDDIIFANCGALHSGEKLPGSHEDCHYTAVTFDPKLIYGFDASRIYEKYVSSLSDNFSCFGFCIHHEKMDTWEREFSEHTRSLISNGEKSDAGFELSVVSDLSALWRLFYLHGAPEERSQKHLNARNYGRIRDIISFIEENYQDDISLEDIARSVGFSRSECSRTFKAGMNVALFSFLQEYRVKKSLSYLTDTDTSISEIAGLVGIPDSNYFSKVFSRVMGCSPRDYRIKMTDK